MEKEKIKELAREHLDSEQHNQILPDSWDYEQNIINFANAIEAQIEKEINHALDNWHNLKDDDIENKSELVRRIVSELNQAWADGGYYSNM